MAHRVVVLADDLIWQTRLVDTVRGLGISVSAARSRAQLERLLPAADAVIVDLTATAYEPITAIEAVAAERTRVLAVGQHDDLALRKRALEAGADRVYAYRKLFEDGPATLAAWLGVGQAATAP